MTAYSTMHKRLTRMLGKASDFECADCGKPANDWAYNGEEPRLYNEIGTPYSTDIDNYYAKCKPCHLKGDFNWTHCKQGHEYTEENTYWKPGPVPWRECRTCRHDRQQRRQLAR